MYQTLNFPSPTISFFQFFPSLSPQNFIIRLCFLKKFIVFWWIFCKDCNMVDPSTSWGGVWLWPDPLREKFEHHVHERREKTREKIGALTPLYKILSLEKKIKIFNDVLLPSLTFGSRVYFQKSKQIDHSNDFMHTQLCNLLRIKTTSNQIWIRWECKITEWEIQTTANKFKFIHKLYHCKNVSLYKNKILENNSYFISNILQQNKGWGDLISSPSFKKSKKIWIKKKAA